MSDGKEIAETFHNYFNNAVKSLNLRYDPKCLNDVFDENDPILIVTKKFKNHPSIVNIQKYILKTSTFSFDETEIDSIQKMTDNLDSRKSGTFEEIPVNFIKNVPNISAKLLGTAWNDEVLKDLTFPSELKLAGVVTVLKKGSTLVEN